jgi:hypothetical protein
MGSASLCPSDLEVMVASLSLATTCLICGHRKKHALAQSSWLSPPGLVPDRALTACRRGMQGGTQARKRSGYGSRLVFSPGLETQGLRS